MMRRFIRLAASLALAAPTFMCAAMESSKPNIVYLLIDDLGWADVGFNGGNAPTPNLDRLAREGVQLTRRLLGPKDSARIASSILRTGRGLPSGRATGS